MEDYKAKGNDAFKAKRYQEAIDWYTKAIGLNPNDEASGALYSNRAGSWQNLNNFEKAAADSEQCIRLRPDWLKGYFRLGVAMESMSKYDEAQKAFQKALQLSPGNEEVMDKLHTINTKVRDRNEKIKSQHCKTPEEAKKLGNSFFKDGKYDQAAEFYTRAIELQTGPVKEKAVYYTNRAACHQQTHMYSLMVDDCNAAIEIDPANVKAYLRRGIAYEGMEKWKLALEDYTKAQSVSPGVAGASQGILRCQRLLRN
ncbi:stress-inducible protein STI1 homolog [Leishmania mexicana MHOM/GT/2001/U1103]|uniref:Stress-inducible protein STI1 homolog n=1 Tax=Leishmania mexicana (strain MHOM/GT/2001/U1103) TaxID=929439 RepID=E9ASC5_LEIMU|nr:stress-inducible protein STI1 homolog [Leishmania mexicana MHOM/GT/2001/U1103]CBZ25847.1 stress-inducible protein STI1 homolog [Leishmania mexicana MHOM/GT/2001/U1103]